MIKRASVFSCLGLGDGLIALVLSNNLKLNGFEATTFHPSLSALQRWFPGLPVSSFLPACDLDRFDSLFVLFEKSPWMERVVEACLTRYRERSYILNPIATSNSDYLFWEEGKF